MKVCLIKSQNVYLNQMFEHRGDKRNAIFFLRSVSPCLLQRTSTKNILLFLMIWFIILRVLFAIQNTDPRCQSNREEAINSIKILSEIKEFGALRCLQRALNF